MSISPVSNSEPKANINRIKTIGASALITSGATFLATKAPNGTDTVKLSKRIIKSGFAGAASALLMAIATSNKEELVSAFNNVKDFISSKFNKENNKSALQPVNAEENQEAVEIVDNKETEPAKKETENTETKELEPKENNPVLNFAMQNTPSKEAE